MARWVFVPAITGALLAGGAHAQSYGVVSDYPIVTVLSVDAVDRTGEFPRSWIVMIPRIDTDLDILALRSSIEADCSKGRQRTLVFQVILKDRQPTRNTPQEWTQPTPGSVHHEAYEYICGKRPSVPFQGDWAEALKRFGRPSVR